jgi:hypothetical protein
LEADVEHLEQIIALKFLGFLLNQGRDILERTSVELGDALRWLRRGDRGPAGASVGGPLQAVRADEKALDLGQPARPAILKRIIEVIDVQHDIELMKRSHSEEAWERRRRYYERGHRKSWRAPGRPGVDLFREIESALGADPAGETAGALASRWMARMDDTSGGTPESKLG